MKYCDEAYGLKASVLKKLSHDKEFCDDVPKMVCIPDTVFYDFLVSHPDIYDEIKNWLAYDLEDENEEREEAFLKLKDEIIKRYVPFLQEKFPFLPKEVEEAIGKGKKVIVRSSGMEDREGSINAGGNASLPDVEIDSVYEGIAHVITSYFTPKVLSILYQNDGITLKPETYRCPVFMQEMIGTTTAQIDFCGYPVLDNEIVKRIARKILALRDRFGMAIDSEWVLKRGNLVASLVGFSNEPFYGSDSVYLLCSLGTGSVVRRTAFINATNYIIPYGCGHKLGDVIVECPEQMTKPYEFTYHDTDIYLVQCRPAGTGAGVVRINRKVSQLSDETLKKEAICDLRTLVVGTGDVDGRILIAESISEAWDEWIAAKSDDEYVGCIVRTGSALEHAGIMFMERGVPVVTVSDKDFMQLITENRNEFILCQSRNVILPKNQETQIEYIKGQIGDASLNFNNISVYTNQELFGDICHEKIISEDIEYALLAYDFYDTYCSIAQADRCIEDDLRTIFTMAKKVYQNTEIPTDILQVVCSLMDILRNAYKNGTNKDIHFWKRTVQMISENKIMISYSNRGVSFQNSLWENVSTNIRKKGDNDKIIFLSFLSKRGIKLTEYQYYSLLFSFKEESVDKLPVSERTEYLKYQEFINKYSLFQYTFDDLKEFYCYYDEVKPTIIDDDVMRRILRGNKPIYSATLYLKLLMHPMIAQLSITEEINICLGAPQIMVHNIDNYVILLQVLCQWAGLGDLSILQNHMMEESVLVDIFANMALPAIYDEIQQIFWAHQRGILDTNVIHINKLREILCADLDYLEQKKIICPNVFDRILKNIIANIVNTVVDLFDIEGKSYANSLAMGIYGIYPTYLAHLEKWNEFLRKSLLDIADDYGKVSSILKEKLDSLKKVRNYNVVIQVDNAWYEKIYMDIDFNLHEIQNIIHQSSIYFSNKKYYFAPSSYVREIYQGAITFGLTNRKILRNQNDYVEIELGLGSYKLHKSSIILRPQQISAQYTEAPFISIGRILVLKKIFEILNEICPELEIRTRLQKRSGDHLLFVYFGCNNKFFSSDEMKEVVEIVCSIFDSFELGGGLTEEEAQSFICSFCNSRNFSHFIKCLVHYHSLLKYTEYMGGGLEENDVCIYQSLLALMVIFPERFDFLQHEMFYGEMLTIMMKNLKKPEWKTDKYELKEGWLTQAYSICLAVLYPFELKESLIQGNDESIPDKKLCELYLSLIGNC